MTDEERNRLSTFEARLRHLIYLHEELQRENIALKEQLDEQQRACQRMRADYEALETNYTNLKTAMTISLDGSDVNKARLRLSKLVREVDKCIALLKT
jgi:phage shock protein A